MDTHCQHCDSGCTIYYKKPEICTNFECSYLQAQNVPVELRPDNCGVIFAKTTDRVFSGTLVTGVATTDAAKGQIQAFLMQVYAVVLVSTEKDTPYVMAPKGENPRAMYREYEEAISGNVRN